MKRYAMNDLIEWKNSKRRKPLIVNGARQVGKTWLLKEFGANHYENIAYINFDDNKSMAMQFETDYDISRIISMIKAGTGEPVVPGKTLIIFDEIQECPKALTSLKYFRENAPEYHVATAGSLLGLTMHEGTGYPVGNVNTLDLYPFNFNEFLDAIGKESIREAISEGDEVLLNALVSKIEPLLKIYYFVGGMPEVVAEYAEDGSFRVARDVQLEILQGYERDISKHLSAREAEYVIDAWNSIPSHLGKENKKFIFGHIKSGSRARDYRSAITWLTKSGIAFYVPRVSKPVIPLSAYADSSAFKLFCVDVGLLGAMVNIDSKTITEGNRIFTEFKGAMTEQYVCQQLLSSCKLKPYYWSAENARAEVDFIVQDTQKIYPIEVKAEENLQAKSLRIVNEKFADMNCRRFSLAGFREQSWMKNIPLWAIGYTTNWE